MLGPKILVVIMMVCAAGCVASPMIKATQVLNEHGEVILGSPDIMIPPPDTKLPVGEKLTYDVRWLGMRIGSMTLAVTGIKNVGGRDAYVLEATMKTNDALAKIYRIEDRFISYMDVEKLYTVRHEVYRRDGKYKKDAVTDFDQVQHKAYFRNSIDNSEKTFDIPPGVQDALTACYYLMLLPLNVGGRAEYFVCNNESNYRFFGFIRSKAMVRLPPIEGEPGAAGERAAFLVQPSAQLKGAKIDKGNVNAYFSCDKRRIPLVAKIRGPVFSEVAMYLVKIENN